MGWQLFQSCMSVDMESPFDHYLDLFRLVHLRSPLLWPQSSLGPDPLPTHMGTPSSQFPTHIGIPSPTPRTCSDLFTWTSPYSNHPFLRYYWPSSERLSCGDVFSLDFGELKRETRISPFLIWWDGGSSRSCVRVDHLCYWNDTNITITNFFLLSIDHIAKYAHLK